MVFVPTMLHKLRQQLFSPGWRLYLLRWYTKVYSSWGAPVCGEYSDQHVDHNDACWLVSTRLLISVDCCSWLSRFSATNCARAYDIALSRQQESDLALGGWQFCTTLTAEHIWDAFVIYTLLQDHCARDICMQVPHMGSQKDRFTELMKQRNDHVILYGQDKVLHTCDKCLHIVQHDDGTYRKSLFSFIFQSSNLV